MDIKAKIEEIVDEIQRNPNFAKDFKDEPVKAIESVVGMDLPDDQIESIIQAVKAKISADKAEDVLGSIKKLF
jgi:uncharacterized protein YpuA (DUF1002 family)